MARLVLVAVALAAWAGSACHGGRGTPADAGGHDAEPLDVPPMPDGGPQALAVDFTVTGCPTYDFVAPRCTGAAPLTLGFVPVTSPTAATFNWDFGDNTPLSSQRTPTHTYALPGRYDVTLFVASAAGTATNPPHPGFVDVLASPGGGLCDLDAHCAEGQTCLCVPGTVGCPSAFTRGLCTAPCDGDCGAGQVCADLALSADGDAAAAAEPWRKRLCLAACTDDGDCATGLRCRSLPGVTAPWVKACFVGVPGDVGASCRSPAGALSSTACVTGLCEDLGANGLCSLDCSAASCPAGAACARLTDGRALCLTACTVAGDCSGDPWLGCEAPGGTGDLAFSVAGAPAGARYCAPRSCTEAKDCGLSGLCRAGHCGK